MIHNKNHIESLPPDILNLLDAEKQHSAMPAGAKEKILGKIAVSVGISSSALMADFATSSSSTPTFPDGNAIGETITEGASQAATEAVSSGGGIIMTLMKIKTIVSFVLGVSVGAGGYAAYENISSEKTHIAPSSDYHQDETDGTGVVEDEILSNPSTPSIEEPTDNIDNPDALLESQSKAVIGRSDEKRKKERNGIGQEHPESSFRPNADTALIAERQLIETARTALARGNSGDAVEMLNKHKNQFSQGALQEERDALMILAVNSQGNAAKAKILATRFLKKYPNSVFRVSIERSLQ